VSEALDRLLASRERAEVVASLRRLGSRAPGPGNGGAAKAPLGEGCDLCGADLPPDHRHLLHLTERRILCACEPCLALRSGDPELRPTGTRIVWLDDMRMSDELWARFQIPIGLAFFMIDSAMERVVALYPSPAGATESELDLDAWDDLLAANPRLRELEPDVEALVVNRMADAPLHAIAPIDECYRLVGLMKASWQGISGGDELEGAIAGFFEELRERSGRA
jgi:hypothetical protein